MRPVARCRRVLRRAWNPPLGWLSAALMMTAPTMAAEPDGSAINFARDIRPIFAAHCGGCHGVKAQEGGLRLDHGPTALRGGDSGPLLTPGNRDRSELYRRITSDDESVRMPPPYEDGVKPLSQEQVARIGRWIDAGAKWPDDGSRLVVQSDHWAYQPLADAPAPPVRNEAWVRNEIDRYILARLEQADLKPSPEADRYTLIKRLSYDLAGLPPTPAEVDEFVHDTRPDAYERVVERLLRSPHFGERWGRHWLDKARYADSDGYEKDRPRPTAWRYRDWVIAAVNADMPMDRFTVEQLAGDLLPDATPMQKLATAFHRQTLTNTEGGTDKEEFRVEAVFDRVETTGTVWLGLSVGCARCHSHKYDQITQAEYYQLFAFFNNGDETNTDVPINGEAVARYEQEKAAYDRLLAAQAKKLRAYRNQFAATLPEPLPAVAGRADGKASGTALDYYLSRDPKGRTLLAQLEQIRKRAPKSPFMSVAVISQRTKVPRTTHLLRRGDFLQPQAAVEPDTLAVLPPLEPRDGTPMPDRLDLARWLMSDENPLTPRVLVNHVWGHLFGRGLVTTMNDFGVRGERPTHPELLDHLARRYRDEFAWSRKRLIREIVLSAVYRQQSGKPKAESGTPEGGVVSGSGSGLPLSAFRSPLSVDPENRLLWRQNRVRVEAEIVRDLYLAASGLLAPQVGGPSVFPPLPADVAALSYANNFKWAESTGADRYRRGLYTFFKRTAPHPNLTTFDCPDANTTSVARQVSNTPLMALTTLNNAVFVEAAQQMASRVLSERPNDTERLEYAFRLCVARPPESAERERFQSLLNTARRYYDEQPDAAKQLTAEHRAESVPVAESAAWAVVCRTMLNMDEFITRE